jgi:hypothetical protein
VEGAGGCKARCAGRWRVGARTSIRGSGSGTCLAALKLLKAQAMRMLRPAATRDRESPGGRPATVGTRARCSRLRPVGGGCAGARRTVEGHVSYSVNSMLLL